MIEFLVESILELAIELVFQGGGELLVEGVARLLGAPFGRRDRNHPVAAGAGLLLLGAMLGLVSWWVWPYRIVASGPYPGISLVISPLSTACSPTRWGHGGRTTIGRAPTCPRSGAARCSPSAWPASASG